MLKFYTKPKRQNPEARLQKAVVAHLMLTATPGVLWFSVPNEGKRSVVMGGHLNAMGMRPGTADIIFIRAGRAYAMELKAKGNVQSAAQLLFQADCQLAKTPYACCDNIDAALRTLRAWGMIKTKAQARLAP